MLAELCVGNARLDECVGSLGVDLDDAIHAALIDHQHRFVAAIHLCAVGRVIRQYPDRESACLCELQYGAQLVDVARTRRCYDLGVGIATSRGYRIRQGLQDPGFAKQRFQLFDNAGLHDQVDSLAGGMLKAYCSGLDASTRNQGSRSW